MALRKLRSQQLGFNFAFFPGQHNFLFKTNCPLLEVPYFAKGDLLFLTEQLPLVTLLCQQTLQQSQLEPVLFILPLFFPVDGVSPYVYHWVKCTFQCLIPGSCFTCSLNPKNTCFLLNSIEWWSLLVDDSGWKVLSTFHCYRCSITEWEGDQAVEHFRAITL